jgi:hypothetical protein
MLGNAKLTIIDSQEIEGTVDGLKCMYTIFLADNSLSIDLSSFSEPIKRVLEKVGERRCYSLADFTYANENLNAVILRSYFQDIIWLVEFISNDFQKNLEWMAPQVNDLIDKIVNVSTLKVYQTSIAEIIEIIATALLSLFDSAHFKSLDLYICATILHKLWNIRELMKEYTDSLTHSSITSRS